VHEIRHCWQALNGLNTATHSNEGLELVCWSSRIGANGTVTTPSARATVNALVAA
jgi:hypothetical protein